MGFALLFFLRSGSGDEVLAAAAPLVPAGQELLYFDVGIHNDSGRA